MVTIRRVYDAATPGKQYQVLVDRLWPRGVSKEKATWDEWMKDVGPGDELRRWFNHDPGKWDQFRVRYKQELTQKQAELDKLKQLERKYGVLTLVYAAKDEAHNNAQVLKEVLMEFVIPA